jgi:chitinase
VQSDYQFLNIFKASGGAVTPPPPPPPPPPPVCNASSWVQGRRYAAGSVVSYRGNVYIANASNPGYNPTISTYYWSRYAC